MKFSIKDVEEFMIPQKEVSGQIAKVINLTNKVGRVACISVPNDRVRDEEEVSGNNIL